MKYVIAICLVAVLAPCAAMAQDTNAILTMLKVKPHSRLPAYIKSSSAVIKHLKGSYPVELRSGPVSWQEFRLWDSIHFLVIWFDPSPPQRSASGIAMFSYYHDGHAWRFHSLDIRGTADSRMSATADIKKRRIVYANPGGVVLKTIPFQDVYMDEIKKQLVEEKRKSSGSSNN